MCLACLAFIRMLLPARKFPFWVFVYKFTFHNTQPDTLAHSVRLLVRFWVLGCSLWRTLFQHLILHSSNAIRFVCKMQMERINETKLFHHICNLWDNSSSDGDSGSFHFHFNGAGVSGWSSAKRAYRFDCIRWQTKLNKFSNFIQIHNASESVCTLCEYVCDIKNTTAQVLVYACARAGACASAYPHRALYTHSLGRCSVYLLWRRH